MNPENMTDLGIIFIVLTVLVTAFGLWVWYSDTHPKKP